MLHRSAGSALLLWGLLTTGSVGCRASSDAHRDHAAAPVAAKTEVVTPSNSTGSDPAKKEQHQHGENWQDPDEEKVVGGFQMFKEAWVYADGKPVGVIREAEMPTLPEVWVDKVELLDFKAGDPGPHERPYQVRRWRVTDYLASVGVDVKRVKAVFLHGGRGVAKIDGKELRKLKDKILFDLTGNNGMKLRVFLPDELLPHLNTHYDRYAAISAFVDKPVPVVDDRNQAIIDGTEVVGIPYYGQPLRGGIRVYVDGRLAITIKRNALGDEARVAPGQNAWNLGKLLAARGYDPATLGALDVIDKQQIVTRHDGAELATLSFHTDEQAQGVVVLSDGSPANAMMLWSKGKVPPVKQVTPAMRDVPSKKLAKK